MDKDALCTAHAEWFGRLLEELVVPIARDFMRHGIKHGEELAGQPQEPLWWDGTPPDSETVYVARFSDGYSGPVYSMAWYHDRKWRAIDQAGTELHDVVAWFRLPKWEVRHG